MTPAADDLAAHFDADTLRRHRPPERLSEVLKRALDALEALEHDPHYRPVPGSVHEPHDEDGEPCAVGLAGAYLVRYGALVPELAYDESLRALNPRAARAADALALCADGAIGAALALWRSAPPGAQSETIEVPHYAEDRRGWHRTMRHVVKVLRAHTL